MLEGSRLSKGVGGMNLSTLLVAMGGWKGEDNLFPRKDPNIVSGNAKINQTPNRKVAVLLLTECVVP
jgi:hypothetical protein